MGICSGKEEDPGEEVQAVDSIEAKQAKHHQPAQTQEKRPSDGERKQAKRPVPHGDTEVLSISVPRKVVGRIIGSGGQNIQRMQSEHGVAIKVDSKQDPSLVTISGGNKYGREAAYEEVDAIAHPPRVELPCPKNKIGAIIGKGGATIKSLRAQTGANIEILDKQTPAKVVITGTQEGVKKAEDLVTKIISPPKKEFKCSSRQAGKIIGPGGANIRALEQAHGARIRVERVGGGESSLVIITAPTPQALDGAADAVDVIIHPLAEEIECPADAVGAFVGDDGENIKDLKKSCGRETSIDILGASDHSHSNTNAKVRIRVEVASRDRKKLRHCVDLVRREIKEVVAGMDYMGDEGRKLRAKANEYAHKRSQYYEASQSAYAKGDRAGAKRLADKGKECGEKMREFNLQASKTIFAHRNAGKPDLFIDLHGLTVKEALGFLRERLDKFLSNDKDDPLECVTGAGNHSPNHTAKIKPAVHELIISMGLKYDVENVGTYIIHC